MPELPEVETIRRTLWPRIEGLTIARARIVEERLPQNRTPKEMESLLTGRRIEGLGRRGKFLLFSLSRGDGMLLHLRMTGQLLYLDDDESPHPHTRMVLYFASGGRLELRDQRRFATLHWVEGGRFDAMPSLRHLGPEPLDPEFTPERLAERLGRRRCAVKVALLNQTVVAGLGNIYADEALFRAGICPSRRADSLDEEAVVRLHQAVVDVLNDALCRGGSSVRTYRTGDGERGSFQEMLNVYGRAGAPCSRCGEPIQRAVMGGRSTWWCPQCQT